MANGDPRLIPVQVQRAYDSGATVSQVLTAVEVGRCLADLPAAAAAMAWHAAHAWAWIARRAEKPSRLAVPAGVAERRWRSGDRTPGLPAAA